MTYQKPKNRPGLVCWSVRWNPDGTIREARFRPRERVTVPDEQEREAPTFRRGLVAASAATPAQGQAAQGRLI